MCIRGPVGLLAALSLLAGCGGRSSDPSTSPSVDVATPAATSEPIQAVAATGVSVIEDEPYRDGGHGEASTVDIYVGDGSDDRPLVVLLHGFGLIGPGRPLDDLGPLDQEIAELGATVFYFSWQTGSGFSADSVADLSCVGPFVAARAAEFGADPDQACGG